VRDEARAAVADAFSRAMASVTGAEDAPATGAGAGTVAHPTMPPSLKTVLERVRRVWDTLQPPVPLAEPWTVGQAVIAARSAGLSVGAMLSEGSALVLGHTLLVFHVETGALEAADVVASLEGIITTESTTFSGSNPAPSLRDSGLPSGSDMLSRPLFTRDEDNDYTESVVSVFLAAVHAAAIIAGISGSLVGEAAPAMSSESAVAAAALPRGSQLEVQIDRRDAWVGGTPWHPVRLRGAYAASVSASLLRLAELCGGSATASSVDGDSSEPALTGGNSKGATAYSSSPLTMREALARATRFQC
jgi:hypothetical protein